MFGAVRFVLVQPGLRLLLLEVVLFLYDVLLVLVTFLLYMFVHHASSIVSRMVYVTIYTFDVIVFSYPGTLTG